MDSGTGISILWWLTAILGGFSLCLILMNSISGIIAMLKGRNYSAVPFIGGILGCIACWTCPVTWVRYLSWVPLLIDFTIPCFFRALLQGVFKSSDQ